MLASLSAEQTIILGVAGLIATALLGMLAYTQARKSIPRSKLSISASFQLKSSSGIAFLVNFRNMGRYPVHVESLVLRSRTGDEFRFRDMLGATLESPVRVTDEAAVTMLFPISRLMPRIRSPHAIVAVEARDTLGKRYSYPSRMPWARRALARDIAKKWTTEDQQKWEQRLENMGNDRTA